MDRSDIATETKHWVVKIGSNVFLRGDRQLDRPAFTNLVSGLNALLDDSRRLSVVSSGAVALGREHLGWPEELGLDIPRLQALAALGQSRLIQMYADEFAHYDRKVAQVLLSRADLDDRSRYLNARMALNRLQELDAIPIINENDTVATEELRFGDNDQLAAMTCGLVEADLLVILSDVEAVYDVEVDEQGSRSFTERIDRIGSEDPHLVEVAGPSTSSVGTGGMQSKVDAARLAARMGVPTIIARGKRPDVLVSIAHGDDIGTLIEPSGDATLAGKKVWLGTGARAVGTILCDAGAVQALRTKGASLLPSGVVEVRGEFEEGDVVELADTEGECFARGVAIYNSDAIGRLAGHQSDEIPDILGYRLLDAVVHRDQMAMIG